MILNLLHFVILDDCINLHNEQVQRTPRPTRCHMPVSHLGLICDELYFCYIYLFKIQYFISQCLSWSYIYLFHIHFILTCMCVCLWVCRCFFTLNSWVRVSVAQGSWKHITETAEGRLYIPALNYTACSLMNIKLLALIIGNF